MLLFHQEDIDSEFKGHLYKCQTTRHEESELLGFTDGIILLANTDKEAPKTVYTYTPAKDSELIYMATKQLSS